ncbi:MAG: DEAD/DEAH box helicase [Bacteroidales bacterium]|nr:DEAD/DEAH box helicase [Bacteroidales bacterium]
MEFTEFNLHPDLLEGIESIGFETATPIQEQTIPIIMEGKDLIASAQTGTGKTAAFLLPVINRIISANLHAHIKALIIVPTRELAIQIDQQMQGFSYFTPVSSVAVYGGGDGSSYAAEKQALKEGADVVVCTPGRMIAHINMGYVDFKGLEFLILDEADRMLDMGFHDDIMKIIQQLPDKRQNLLYSATMPAKMNTLAKKVLYKPVEVSLGVSKPAENIMQVAYVVYEKQKLPLVKYLLRHQDLRSVIVFCSTKASAKVLGRELKSMRLAVEEMHSDLEQKEREEVLMRFKSRKTSIVVATDILSRGIDIEDIDLVINYDVPSDGEDYIHRIGRTARAKAEGIAITIIGEKEQNKFADIEKLLEDTVLKAGVPSEFGETPKYNPRISVHPKGKKQFYRRKGPRK